MTIQLIAESAAHHEGDKQFIDDWCKQLCLQTKVNILKFHITINVDEYMLHDHPIYENMKSWCFSKDEWSDIFGYIKKKQKKLMLLYNDTLAVEFGTAFLPSLIEIHSVCLNDINLLHAIKNNVDKNTKIVLGVGGSTLYEVENAINVLQSDNIVLMFGFQNYPTNYSAINFSKMRKIMSLYPAFDFGYADHTSGDHENNILVTLLGAACGVQYVEKHVTTQFGKERIDWQSAISIETFNEISEKIKILDECNGTGLLQLNQGEKNYSHFGFMKKAPVLVHDVTVGDQLTLESFTFKRTNQESDVSQLEIVDMLGFEFKCDINKNSVIKKEHLKKNEG